MPVRRSLPLKLGSGAPSEFWAGRAARPADLLVDVGVLITLRGGP